MEPDDFDSLPPAPRLDYATPTAKVPMTNGWALLRVFRRIALAIGMGCFFYGVADLMGHEQAGAPLAMGAALISFSIPLWRFPNEPKR
jgi:hypothetical protein